MSEITRTAVNTLFEEPSRQRERITLNGNLAQNIYNIAHRNKLLTQASSEDQVILALHSKNLLEPAVANFLDRLFLLEPKQLKGVNEKEQAIVDQFVKDEIAADLARSYSYHTLWGNSEVREKILQSINDNKVKDQVQKYYETGLHPHHDSGGVPIPSDHSSDSFIPLIENQDGSKLEEPRFGLADMHLLNTLDLLPETIDISELTNDQRGDSLVNNALRALFSVSFRTPTFFEHSGENFDEPTTEIIEYFTNNEKASDLSSLLDRLDFSKCHSSHDFITKLSNVANEITHMQDFERSDQLLELMDKIAPILKNADSNGDSTRATTSAYSTILERIAALSDDAVEK